MSKRTSGDEPSLVEVLKALARDRLTIGREAYSRRDSARRKPEDEAAFALFEKYCDHPILNFCRLVEDETGLGRHLVEDVACRSNTGLGLAPLTRTPRPPDPAPTDPELDVFPAAEPMPDVPDLRPVLGQLKEYNGDGTTARILRRFEREHPGVLDGLGFRRVTEDQRPGEAADQGRVPMAKREKMVDEALRKLTTADTKQERDDKIRAVRITAVMQKTGLGKSSVGTTTAWTAFEDMRRRRGLSPKPVGKRKPAECPLTNDLLAVIADPNAPDPSGANPAEALTDTTLTDEKVWDRVLNAADTSSERARLANCTPAKRRELIHLTRSQLEDQRRDQAPRRPRL
jgi:hypothetical protein